MKAYPNDTTSSTLANSNMESPRPSRENIIWMPCHAMMIVAKDRNRRYPNRRNSGSYVSRRLEIACWIVGSRLSSMVRVLCEYLRLAPGSERISGAGTECFVGRSPVAPRDELHVDGRDVRVSSTLAV